MIGKVTTLTTLKPQSPDSQVELGASRSYLINTDAIVELKVYGTTDSEILYKFDIYSDRQVPFEFTVDQTNAAIQTLADATPASPKVTLTVYDDIQSFALVGSATTTSWAFNVADIVWGENDSTGAYSRIWVMEGGHKIVPYIVNHNIDQVIDLADTGTTTTTTTSTSTTSTSTSSTSTSSTSSTSTSSTSTSSTSSTSTSSTSTTSTTSIA